MNRKLKPVYFNGKTEKSLLDFAAQLTSFSEWVKGKIREELGKSQEGVKKENGSKTVVWKDFK